MLVLRVNPSYWWQARVSVEAHNRWRLTPLNSRSADIPLVSASRPIRIDCSAAPLFHGQVIAGSSSSLTLMMLRIDLWQLSVSWRCFRVPVHRSLSWCWSLIRDRKHRHKYDQTYVVNPERVSGSEEVFSPFFVGFLSSQWELYVSYFSYLCPSLSHPLVSFTFTFPSAERTHLLYEPDPA